MSASSATESTAPSHAVVLEARDTAERKSPLAVRSRALYDFANTKFQWL